VAVPAETTTIDTPDGLYCKAPAGLTDCRSWCNETILAWATRGSVRAVQMCDGDKPFEPVAERQHVLGPYHWIRT